jgi:hypothetical protein
MTSHDDRLGEYLTEALALVSAYVRDDEPAVRALLRSLPTREDVSLRYTALAALLATHYRQFAGDPDEAIQQLLLATQITIAEHERDI